MTIVSLLPVKRGIKLNPTTSKTYRDADTVCEEADAHAATTKSLIRLNYLVRIVAVCYETARIVFAYSTLKTNLCTRLSANISEPTATPYFLFDSRRNSAA